MTKKNIWLSNKILLATILLVIVTTQSFLPPEDAHAAGKRLLFMLFDADHSIPDYLEAVCSDPKIDGLALEARWFKIEAFQGKYDWSNLDEAIRIAAKHKKYVSIHFLGSPRVPIWLREAGAQTYASGNITSMIVIDAIPWDKEYLNLYTKFLQTAAAHFKTLNMTPYIFAVGMVAPSKQCSLTGCSNGKMGTVVYNRTAYMNACKRMVDTYATCFPTARQFISPPTDETICAPVRDRTFFRELMDYALTKHKQGCWLFARDLKVDGSKSTAPYLDYARCTGSGYQMAGGSNYTGEGAIGGSPPDNLGQAISAGVRNGGLYFEVYSNDVSSSDPSIQAALNSIHK